MPASGKYTASQWPTVSSALTRKSGVLCTRRNAIAGAQYDACSARSSYPLTKLQTSGETLYAAARSASGAASASGRPRNTSSAKRSAMKRSRAAFSPSVDGTTNDNATSASQATKTPRIGRPGASTIAPTQKSAAAVASCHEKGKRPGLRNTSTSAACRATSGSSTRTARHRRNPATTTTRSNSASGLAAHVSKPNTGSSRRHSSASNANATPSMNGYAPESTNAPHTTANASTAGGYATTRANAAAATPADSAASTLIPTTTANG